MTGTIRFTGSIYHRYAALAAIGATTVLLAGCLEPSTTPISPTGQLSSGHLLPQIPSPSMTEFTDASGGFSARVPAELRRVVMASEETAGITISFESPPSSEQDQFADYLMVDIQPGNQADWLSQTVDERTSMIVAGQEVYRERILLDAYPVADSTLDLVAWQVRLVQPGYSVGMFVIGERREDPRLERILIEFAYSFTMPAPPFLISRRQTGSPVGWPAVQERYRSG